MSEISQHAIKHLSSISVRGNDAMTFLQGQCTQDIAKIPSFGALPGAFCTAKGRVISNVWLHRVDESQESFELICHHSSAQPLFTHLKKYVPFFRGTTMTVNDSLSITGYIGNAQSQLPGFSLNDKMNIVLNYSDDITSHASASQWLVEEIRSGVLWLDEHQIDKWIPQNINLDTLNAISFSKGCYTGQEVVARLHYKGSSKKRLYALRTSTKISASQPIVTSGKNIGTVLQIACDEAHYYALAVLNSSAIDNALFVDETEQVAIELLHSF